MAMLVTFYLLFDSDKELTADWPSQDGQGCD
jgi:hypothetical protein